jgi:hypothetical protein
MLLCKGKIPARRLGMVKGFRQHTAIFVAMLLKVQDHLAAGMQMREDVSLIHLLLLLPYVILHAHKLSDMPMHTVMDTPNRLHLHSLLEQHRALDIPY